MIIGVNVSFIFSAMTSVPENVESISTSPTSIYVWWTPITNSNLTGYIFFYRKRIDQSSPYHSFGINSTVSSANLTWLEPGVEYAFRIMAHSSTGNGISSNLQYQRTMEKGTNIMLFGDYCTIKRTKRYPLEIILYHNRI